jgi:type III pantothenate kinase
LILKVEDALKSISRTESRLRSISGYLERQNYTNFKFLKKNLKNLLVSTGITTFALFRKYQMDLAIDIGNTLTKLAVFANEEIIELQTLAEPTIQDIEKLLNENPEICNCIVSSVKELDEKWISFISKKTRLLILDNKTTLPFSNLYLTPDTLGRDRIAAVAGAGSLFPAKNVLVIDAGTCITYDILTNQNKYLGGAISPGIEMRLKALHTFTDKLPLVTLDLSQPVDLIGKSTDGSITSGVQLAVRLEVEATIEEYKNQFDSLKIVLTGGDLFYFDKYLKNNIFAAPNLVLIGLKKILDFNEVS